MKDGTDLQGEEMRTKERERSLLQLHEDKAAMVFVGRAFSTLLGSVCKTLEMC